MKGLFNKIFKLQDNVDYQSLLQEGAVVVDVRSKEEYLEGHIRNSLNIPLDVLNRNIAKLDKESVIITVCQSGIRSRSAANFLKEIGFSRVYNGGSWHNLRWSVFF